jgi:hypothetical protein
MLVGKVKVRVFLKIHRLNDLRLRFRFVPPDKGEI